MQQFLQGTTVVQTAAYFGHQGLGNVKGEAASGQATIEDVAEVLFPERQAGQCLRTQGLRRRLREPRAAGQRVSACCCNQRWTSAGDSSWGFMLYRCHMTHIHVKKELSVSRIKNHAKNQGSKLAPAPDLTRDFEFRSRN